MNKSGNILLYLFLTLTAVLIGGTTGFILYSVWDLPEVQALEEYKPSITSRVYSGSNKLLAEYYMENRTPVELKRVPKTLIQAVIATEDSRFYSHRGLDFRGIGRAIYRNVRARKIVEGGSTLTQQLSKVLFLTPEKSFVRKLKEIALALKIEQRYTKQEILSLYLNQIYFGSGAYGVEAAAKIYFGKSAEQLTLPECAMIAGLPRSPNRYSPFKDPANAFGRRSYVLNRMVSAGVITKQQAEEAKKAPLPVHMNIAAGGPAPYFVEYIRQKIEERFGSGMLYSGGLNIHTSIDDELQNQAEASVKAGLDRLEAKLRRKGADLPPLQAALISIEPATGHIRAMVGGRDFKESQFNRAWQAIRQPGSAFKPIVYASAIEQNIGPADMLDDSPATYRVANNKKWTPENFTKTYQGRVTLRRALAQSLNVPTVRLLEKAGLERTIRFAKKLGIKNSLQPYLSLALGSSDITLLELASAYSVFANHGIRREPSAILMVTDSAGQTLYSSDPAPEQVMKPETAFLITNLLKGVIEHGTGVKARGLGRPAAGKTGTTNDYMDAWFIGYTPSFVAGIWVGYDDHRTIGRKMTGSVAALPIWLDFMKRAHKDLEPEDFPAPEGIIFKQIDPRTGLLSTDNCRQSIREAFLPGTEPRKYCSEASVVPEQKQIQDEAP